MDINSIENNFTATVYFDQDNRNWNPEPQYNTMFLRSQFNYLSDRLAAQGHLFLNEVFDSLGFPRTSLGAIVGWTDPTSARLPMEWTYLQPGKIEIRFQTDGLIWDKIGDSPKKEPFHDVLMVAFDVSGPNAQVVHNWLHEQMPKPGSHQTENHNEIELDSWWVANDERFDRSDTDSAVFVAKGNQEVARFLLREHGLGN